MGVRTVSPTPYTASKRNSVAAGMDLLLGCVWLFSVPRNPKKCGENWLHPGKCMEGQSCKVNQWMVGWLLVWMDGLMDAWMEMCKSRDDCQ